MAADREPDDTEPFSSTTSESPHLCIRQTHTAQNSQWGKHSGRQFDVIRRNPLTCVECINSQKTRFEKLNVHDEMKKITTGSQHKKKLLLVSSELNWLIELLKLLKSDRKR